LSEGGKRVDLHTTDISDWRITFVDTGLHANIAERLVRVRKHLEGEPVFLANYADGLSDVPIDRMIADFEAKQVVASFAAVNDLHSFHTVDATPDGYATRIDGMANQDLLINGGYFVLRQDIFDYIEPGDELVEGSLQAADRQAPARAYRHSGFWRAMDTFKDKITFDRMEARGDCPWAVWKR
jgi:glucose-1-phosphate cytidylyltransferase